MSYDIVNVLGFLELNFMLSEQNISPLIKINENLSLTAYRILMIFELLNQSRYGNDDINRALASRIQNFKPLSDDTIGIYINTLRELGCCIPRPSKKTEFKYQMLSHPFSLKFDESDIKFLIELKKLISVCCDWRLVANTDRLIDKILNFISPEKKKSYLALKKNLIRDISSAYQSKLLDMLDLYCSKKRTLIVSYDSVQNKNKEIKIVAEKLSYQNGAFYLWGYNPEYEESQYLRVDRINEISAINISGITLKPSIITAVYRLGGTSASVFCPDEDETVIEKRENGEIIIESKVKNRFWFYQKILSFGADCTVIYPETIRREIVKKLRLLQKVYECENDGKKEIKN